MPRATCCCGTCRGWRGWRLLWPSSTDSSSGSSWHLAVSRPERVCEVLVGRSLLSREDEVASWGWRWYVEH